MKKFLCLFALALVSSLPSLAQTTVRVNCGGPQYTDSKGNVWKADFGFSGGKPLTNSGAISGTPDPTLFETFRWDPGNYVFQVPNGKYQIGRAHV